MGVRGWAKVKPFLAGYRVLVAIKQKHRKEVEFERPALSWVGFPGGSEVKVSAWNAGDLCSIPGWGRSPGEGNGSLLQYSCLENPMEEGAW